MFVEYSQTSLGAVVICQVCVYKFSGKFYDSLHDSYHYNRDGISCNGTKKIRGLFVIIPSHEPSEIKVLKQEYNRFDVELCKGNITNILETYENKPPLRL